MVRNAQPSRQQQQHYLARGWWSSSSLSEMVAARAAADGDGAAYRSPSRSLTWESYDREATALAERLAALGLAPGSRVAVFLADGVDVHVAYLACERAGAVAIGIPERAGDRELRHLLSHTAASAMLCEPQRRGRTARELMTMVRDGLPGLELHGEVTPDGHWEFLRWSQDSTQPSAAAAQAAGDITGLGVRPDELWLLNSTSGTTGLPKCVRQTQNRWHYLLHAASEAADLTRDDVMMSLVPSPFGFGLWTAHFAPAVIGMSCVLLPRFDAGAALRAVAEHRVTVLACVSAQFQMMLASPVLDDVDVSSLRVLYTGGENVPPARAAEWERRTGSTVLQFYGSNEVGPFSCTSLRDPEELRLGTVGRLVPGLECRRLDEAGQEVTAVGLAGQAAALSPGVWGGGYFGDDDANQELFTADGYLLMPDLITVDAAGYVRITGRKSDIIIRGGKNLSAPTIEADVLTHAKVEMVAALPVPDPVFGERVCVVVSLRAGIGSLELPELTSHLEKAGVSKEYFPEYLVVLDELPQSMGGKVDKRALKDQLPELLGSRHTDHTAV